MPKYEIRPGLALTTIPGVGVVKPGDVIEGDYDRFVPGKLRRVVGAPAPTPKVAVPPPPPPKPEPEPEEEPLTDEEAAEKIPDFDDEEDSEEEGDNDPPSMSWRKDELVAYAEELGLDTSGTKQDLVDRICDAINSEDD